MIWMTCKSKFRRLPKRQKLKIEKRKKKEKKFADERRMIRHQFL